MLGSGNGGQNKACFGNEDEDMQEIRGLKLTSAFKGFKKKENRDVEMEDVMDEVDAGT